MLSKSKRCIVIYLFLFWAESYSGSNPKPCVCSALLPNCLSSPWGLISISLYTNSANIPSLRRLPSPKSLRTSANALCLQTGKLRSGLAKR